VKLEKRVIQEEMDKKENQVLEDVLVTLVHKVRVANVVSQLQERKVIADQPVNKVSLVWKERMEGMVKVFVAHLVKMV